MRWRFRTNWRGQLILQVGWREPKLSGLPGDTYIRWADATTEDLGHYYAEHNPEAKL
jgi:hypothetical protein